MEMQGLIKRSSRHNFYQKGSLTLAACMMLPAIMILLFSLYNNSLLMREELDAVRVARLSAEGALASYDRSLYRDYGIFAFREEDLNKQSSEYLLAESYKHNFHLSDDPFDKDYLKAAINRHMSVRAIAGLIDEVLGRLNMVQSYLPSDLTALLYPLNELKDDEIGKEIEEDDSNADWLDDYSSYLDEEYLNAYHESLLGLSPVYLPGEDGRYSTVEINPYKPSDLEKLAGVIDSMSASVPSGVSEKLILMEYSVAYFRSSVSSIKTKNGAKEIKTPDGRLHSQFPSSRQNELEQIVNGQDAETAAKSVKNLLIAMRSLINMLSTINSSAEKLVFDSKALAISTTVATISLGTIILEPETISTLLIIIDSLKKGYDEGERLCQGEEVILWPASGKNSFAVNYQDHLRLMILVQPSDKILERIARVIKQEKSDDYYISVLSSVTRLPEANRPGQPAFEVEVKRRYHLNYEELTF